MQPRQPSRAIAARLDVRQIVEAIRRPSIVEFIAGAGRRGSPPNRAHRAARSRLRFRIDRLDQPLRRHPFAGAVNRSSDRLRHHYDLRCPRHGRVFDKEADPEIPDDVA